MASFLAEDALLPFPAQLPYDKQGVPVPGTKRPGQTGMLLTLVAFGKQPDTSYQPTMSMVKSPSICWSRYLSLKYLGMWGLLEPTKYSIQTLPDIFLSGLQKARDKPFLGHRPVLSKQPLKLANHFEWQTYAQVDVRRRNIGSALVHLFRTGVLGGAELETVGIWSINRPGTLFGYSSTPFIES